MIEKIFLFFRDVFLIACAICIYFCILCLFAQDVQELKICFFGAVLTGLTGLLLNYIYENI